MSTSSSILMLMNEYESVTGHGTVVNNISLGLMDLGYDVTIAARSFLDSPPKEIKTKKIKLFDVLKGDLNKYDIIHCHQSLMNYCSLFTKKPFIFHYHGTNSLGMEINRRLFTRLCRNRISKIICLSDASYEWIKNKIGNIPLEIIRNGVNTNFFTINLDEPYKIGKPQLLYVGNLYKTKETPKLVDVMKIILEVYPLAHLQIIGEGDDYKNLQNRIKQEKLEEKIKLVGKIVGNELLRRYSSSDILISTSSSEAGPLPPLEALACGKSLFLRDIPQFEEIIRLSHAGECFSLNDKIQIKEKIKKIFENKTRYSINARKFAEEQDWKNCCERISLVYKKII